MTEVLFYHLQNMSLESVLPPLLEKSLERGWRVVVQSTSQERTEALDAHLWTYRDDSFLPHATWRAGDAQDQPIVLAVEEGNPNRRQCQVSDRQCRAASGLRTSMSAWFWFSTATTPMRSPPRAAPGPIARRGASRSPIGRPTSAAGGSGGISDIRGN